VQADESDLNIEVAPEQAMHFLKVFGLVPSVTVA